MLLCETASKADSAFDELVVFAAQARAAGLPVAIHRKSLPDNLKDPSRFDLAHLVTDCHPTEAQKLVILGAEGTNDDRLRHFRGLTCGRSVESIAYGAFETRQQRIASAARLSYALGAEPDMIDLQEVPGLPVCAAPLFAAPVVRKPRPRPVIALLFPDVRSQATVDGVRGLALSREFDLMVLTHGKAKSAWVELLNHEVPVWHPGELLPRSMSAMIDVAVIFEKPMSWYRLQALFANLVAAGSALIDATAERHWSELPEGVIGGTPNLQLLSGWLHREILPARAEISEGLRDSRLCEYFRVPEELCSPHAPAASHFVSSSQEEQADRILFMPTNGVGLGHAKRCSLVAQELQEPSQAAFAAFPSCLTMLNNAGFDTVPLVSRSPHRASHANDIVNHARIDAFAKSAKGFVFDGGYVFDSVMRSTADNNLPAVWIRRGLWQAGQNNAVPLDRQKLFDRIVVPRESFDELNGTVPGSSKVVEVGPIVKPIVLTPDQRADMLDRIRAKTGMDGRKLVVTMLGGGVAADRKAQINAICSDLAQRDDVLNLLVIWPTATAEPAWYAHDNTVVVRTHHAGALVAAADVYVSAVGYNSFHEAIYSAVPTIFVPQMAPFMDDQRARATAASERDLALLVEPWEIAKLTRTLSECLEGRAEDLRDRLRGINLPETGNRAAARIIEEVCQ